MSFDPNGDFDYLGDDETEEVTFVYTIEDSLGAVDTATVTIRIEGINDLLAEDDSESTRYNETVTGNVLDNDSDPDGDAFTVDTVDGNPVGEDGTSVELPDGGDVTIYPNGTFEFDPGTDFDDLDRGDSAVTCFEYTITDDIDGASAEVCITVYGDDDPPVAVDDTESTDQDTPVSGNVLLNDSDPDGDDLTVIVVEDEPINEEGSSIPLDSGAVVTVYPNGTFVYDPNGAFDSLDEVETAQDCFEYVVWDGAGGSDTATVCIRIEGKNDVVAEDDSYTTNPATSITENIVANDSDPENDSFSVIKVDPDGDGTFDVNVPPGGQVTFVGDKVVGSDPGGIVTLHP
eukprot:CAMPEP_0197436232 /NCGR_PEP_ID=MMETSP1175-20131217/3705_1 /TAXON_ID=1003142 /ORGANISM="Triceratium dubium, Strain CCMP147" /LENGTH=344 /DNA_ID=CAMNT_0042965471 /DNA_START=10 /DNA_END=1041 /DNA_ORIENTATION=-